MAIHTTAVNGMGASTLSGSTITNTGMQANDHMHLSEDFLTTGGIIQDGDWRVTQNGTPNMSVNVAAGRIYIPNSAYVVNSIAQQRFWRATNDATVNVVISANGSGNPRITSIFARFNASATPDDNATNTVTAVAVDGTPAGSPVAPSAPADGNSYERLADITVASGATSITNANITDQRRKAMLINLALADGIAQNYRISPTVSSNNLTVSLLTQDGQTPSTTNPVVVRIGNVNRVITSALSVSANAGTNWFNSGSSELATKEIDYFVYLGYNTTDGVVIGFSRIPYAREYSEFNTTSTNEKFCRISTITNAASGDDYTVIGRFAATLSAGAGYTWTVPTFTNINLIQSPIYESRVMSIAPVGSASSGNWTINTISYARYQIVARKLTISYGLVGTTSSTPSELRATLPMTPVNGAYGGGESRDGGAYTKVVMATFDNQTSVRFYKDATSSAFSAGANREGYAEITYTI